MSFLEKFDFIVNSANKKILVEILTRVAEGVTSYNDKDDEIGHCAFCYITTYKPHKRDCPVLLANDLI